jgi:hypothetical protein
MHFETLTGIGRLWSGDTVVLDAVPYRIDISREIRGGVPGLWRIEGQIDGAFDELTKLVIDSPDNLELELADGRRWGCVIQNNSGRLLNSGRRNLQVPA